MATYSVANERLRVLEDLEREIGTSLQSAGSVILELSKEKPNERLLERQATQFSASMQKVESELSGQIRYLTQASGHGWGQGRGQGLGHPDSPSLSASPSHRWQQGSHMRGPATRHARAARWH
ncbi:mediator of RNA polymerase II transcription subunit 11 isoform X1 [Pelodiscus sinensis]|uniref:mediator of RNA polymerase II transcription subunit 11 isoform X1 n=1 Tax=Pelodiscus sinensis TaxID=13735 RepID=UPI003F6C2FB1